MGATIREAEGSRSSGPAQPSGLQPHPTQTLWCMQAFPQRREGALSLHPSEQGFSDPLGCQAAHQGLFLAAPECLEVLQDF